MIQPSVRDWSPSVPERLAGRRRSVARGEEVDGEGRLELAEGVNIIQERRDTRLGV
jgi:hypothetical protein